jgi:hypothetical protein
MPCGSAAQLRFVLLFAQRFPAAALFPAEPAPSYRRAAQLTTRWRIFPDIVRDLFSPDGVPHPIRKDVGRQSTPVRF